MKLTAYALAAAVIVGFSGVALTASNAQAPTKFATAQLTGQSGPYYEYILTIGTVGNKELPSPAPEITAYYGYDGINAGPPDGTFNNSFSTVYEKKNRKALVITFYIQFGTAQQHNYLALYSQDSTLKLKSVKQILMPTPPNALPPILLTAKKAGNYDYSLSATASPGAGKLPSPPPPFTAAIQSVGGTPYHGTIPISVTSASGGTQLNLSFTVHAAKPGKFIIHVHGADAWITLSQPTSTYSR